MTNNDFDRNINLRNKTITSRDSKFHSNFANEFKIQKIKNDETMFDFNEKSIEIVFDDTNRNENDFDRNDHAIENRIFFQNEFFTFDIFDFTRTKRFRLKKMKIENNLIKKKIRLLKLQMIHANHANH